MLQSLLLIVAILLASSVIGCVSKKKKKGKEMKKAEKRVEKKKPTTRTGESQTTEFPFRFVRPPPKTQTPVKVAEQSEESPQEPEEEKQEQRSGPREAARSEQIIVPTESPPRNRAPIRRRFRRGRSNRDVTYWCDPSLSVEDTQLSEKEPAKKAEPKRAEPEKVMEVMEKSDDDTLKDAPPVPVKGGRSYTESSEEKVRKMKNESARGSRRKRTSKEKV